MRLSYPDYNPLEMNYYTAGIVLKFGFDTYFDASSKTTQSSGNVRRSGLPLSA